MMIEMTCEQCGANFRSEDVPRRGHICFKCHLATVRIGFTYGKEDFHGPTVRERQQKQVAEAKSAGIDAVPVGNRWV